MTVSELIEKLSKCDQSKEMFLELAQDYLLGDKIEEDNQGVWLSCGNELEPE